MLDGVVPQLGNCTPVRLKVTPLEIENGIPCDNTPKVCHSEFGVVSFAHVVANIYGKEINMHDHQEQKANCWHLSSFICRDIVQLLYTLQNLPLYSGEHLGSSDLGDNISDARTS